MATIITFGIQKGGAAKTTTSGITAHILSKEYNKKVLAVDLDSQGNLTELLTQRDIYDYHGYTVLEALQAQDATRFIHTVSENLDLMAADDLLATFPKWMYQHYRGNPATILRETLETVADQYDFIILDTPPALGDITINALSASDYVVAMFEASKFCYSALERFVETYVEVKRLTNPKLELAGILRSLIDARRSDNKALILKVAHEYGEYCFNTVMTRTAAVGRLSIYGFEDNTELLQAIKPHREFVKELLLRCRKTKLSEL
jgi:chromosome partitioning protein